MPYFLNAPASMATNSGACSSDTAGTATLMTLSGISADNVSVGADSKQPVNRIIQSFIFGPFAGWFKSRLLQANDNVQLDAAPAERRFFKLSKCKNAEPVLSESGEAESIETQCGAVIPSLRPRLAPEYLNRRQQKVTTSH